MRWQLSRAGLFNFWYYDEEELERSLDGDLDKIPLTRRELVNVIGEGGELLKNQQEYMERVNRPLFGFKTIDYFNDLIKLLIQLRSPKLSKDFRPTVVYDILQVPKS